MGVFTLRPGIFNLQIRSEPIFMVFRVFISLSISIWNLMLQNKQIL